MENGKVIAIIRQFENETVLVVANLSRFAQVAELDLSAFAGRTPVEVFQPEQFPGDQGADALRFHARPRTDIYWLALQAEQVAETAGPEYAVPVFSAPPGLEIVLDGVLAESFEST